MEKKNSGKIPSRGDIFWVNFEPSKGREQAGRRPALILSPYSYNKKIGLVIVCPITSKSKGYLFEVPLAGKVKGVVLANHIHSFDYTSRDFEYAETVTEEVITQTMYKLRLLLP